MNEWLDGRINVISLFVFSMLAAEIFLFGSLASKRGVSSGENGGDNLHIWRVNMTKNKEWPPTQPP